CRERIALHSCLGPARLAGPTTPLYAPQRDWDEVFAYLLTIADGSVARGGWLPWPDPPPPLAGRAPDFAESNRIINFCAALFMRVSNFATHALNNTWANTSGIAVIRPIAVANRARPIAPAWLATPP